jgi:predicted SAM-dependent methyltransferase
MNTKVLNWMKETSCLLPRDLGNVLDVGSLNVNGSAREVYKLFTSYIGIDMREGKDVDIVMNAHDLVNQFGENSIDTIVCMNTLEHDDKFWLTLEAMNRVLKQDGYMIFCVPTFYFPIHNYPEDFWRMSEQAIRKIIFDGYEVLNMQEIFSKENDEGKQINPCICAIGRKL